MAAVIASRVAHWLRKIFFVFFYCASFKGTDFPMLTVSCNYYTYTRYKYFFITARY